MGSDDRDTLRSSSEHSKDRDRGSGSRPRLRSGRGLSSRGAIPTEVQERLERATVAPSARKAAEGDRASGGCSSIA